MQAQKIPTKQESTDQYAVGQLSHVALVELAKASKDCRRSIDMIVPLVNVSRRSNCHSAVHLQPSNREHGDDHDALLHTHVQFDELGDRHRKDYAIKSDVDACMCPDECIEVDAGALVQAVPRGPNVCDWKTVDRDDHGEDDSVQCRHTDKHVYGSAELLAWEHPKIKEEESELCAPDRDEPEYLGQPRVLHN